MKILLLNQTFYPDVVSTAQHLTDLALALKEQGHDVTVVASRRGYDDPDALFPARETWRSIEIRRISSTRFGKKAKWRRAADFASFLLNCCLRLLFLPKQDVVVALTSPPLISFLAAWFTKLRGGKLCYWVMDLNPDEAIAAGWLNRDSFAGRWLERFSRFSFRSATRIIALDRFMRDRIVAKGIAAKKISVIPPWSHDDHIRFDAVGRERFRATHGLQGKFVVMYSGNHSPCHPLDTLLEAARQFSTLDTQLSSPPIVFCFVGGGSEFKRVQAFKKEHALKNILCLPYQPLAELSGSLSAADLHVVAMGNPFVGIVHPCKIYNILTVGAPVLYLGPTPSHVAEILADLSASYPFVLAPHGDVSGLVEQIPGVREQLKSFSPGTPPDICRRFSRSELLPQMVAAITGCETTHP